jgi:hypothetical protein
MQGPHSFSESTVHFLVYCNVPDLIRMDRIVFGGKNVKKILLLRNFLPSNPWIRTGFGSACPEMLDPDPHCQCLSRSNADKVLAGLKYELYAVL